MLAVSPYWPESRAAGLPLVEQGRPARIDGANDSTDLGQDLAHLAGVVKALPAHLGSETA
jgi:hypothetical protein